MPVKKEPKYKQAISHLLTQFREEPYQSGQQLPTEFDLMKQLSLSRTTVRQAIKELTEQGIVERRHGSGTYFLGFERETPSRTVGMVGLVNFYFTDYIYPEIIRGIEETIDEAGLSLALANSREGIDKEISSVERLIDQGVKGLILEPSRNLQIRDDHPLIRLLDTVDIPVVTTHWGIADKRLSTVTIDDVQAGYEATRYLLDKGHRRISIVYKEDVQAGYDRYLGYRKAMEEFGIRIPHELIRTYNDKDESLDVRQGYLQTQALLEGEVRPTAIFFFNDNIAAQGYSALQESGIGIPGDISVIGFDNFRNADMLYPPLTTFEHPKYNLGKWAAKILLDEMDASRPMIPMKLVFEPILVERDSVRDLRKV
jgi:GntR family transcriptional regulator of arabinose operon